MDNAALQALASLLGKDGINYSVSLEWFRTPREAESDSIALVRRAISSEAVLEGLRPISKHDVLAEVAVCLCYAGDDGAGPGRIGLWSEEFKELLASLILQIEVAFDASESVETFHWKTGHPYYPVFWDFAFLFKTPTEALVLLGSSSD